jgi:hypothetical protein
MKTLFTLCVLGILMTSRTFAQEVSFANVRNNHTESYYHLVGSVENFTSSKNNKIILNWSVDANEDVNRFEVERSYDGESFSVAGLVFGSEKTGKENFMFLETNNRNKIFYRLKVYETNQAIRYSNLFIFEAATNKNGEIRILKNPVTDRLAFRFQSDDGKPMVMKISNMNGCVQISRALSANQGSNLVNLPLASVLSSGVYVIELSKGTQTISSKFVKQ